MAGYAPEHFPALFAVEDRHFWFGARNLVLSTVINQIVRGLPPRYRALEVGCGTGNTLRMLRSACRQAGVVVGMDLYVEGLHYARRRAPVPLVQGSIEQPPFREPFDIVGMFDVLEHVEDDAGALAHAHALTKPGGFLLLTVPAHMSLWSQFDEESQHCRRYEPDQLRDKLVNAGFGIDHLTPFMAALYPFARASRWWSDLMNRARRRMNMPATSAVRADLQVVPVVNDLMRLVLLPELSVLKRRGRLPIGTSLLAVARVS